jgi:hypothetical protein
MEETPLIDDTITKNTHISGMKLSALTQAAAYRAIRENKRESLKEYELVNRKVTSRNMENCNKRLQNIMKSDEVPNNAQIWKSFRHKDFTRRIKYFLWMTMHGGYKTGEYWDRMDNADLKKRGQCKNCGHGTIETMKHILTECPVGKSEVVWQLVKKLWHKKTGVEITITFEDILTCGTLKTREGTYDPGSMRLYRILISESAFLIWKTRNQVIINETPQPIQAVQNKWWYTIDARLKLDCVITRNRFGKKAIQPNLVKGTWENVIENERNLPKNWMFDTGVLVGIG